MKIIASAGNSIERPLSSVFGNAERVTIEQVHNHFAALLGYDPQAVDAHDNGCILGAGSLVSDSAVITIVPKANQKRA